MSVDAEPTKNLWIEAEKVRAQKYLNSPIKRDFKPRSFRIKEYFHTFKFEPHSPPGNIQFIRRGAPGTVDLPKEYVENGGMIAPGVYSTFRSSGMMYAPITVTPESPEKLEFRLLRPPLLQGRIVESPSGKPLGGALVVLEYKFASSVQTPKFTPSDWETFRSYSETEIMAMGTQIDRALCVACRRVMPIGLSADGFSEGVWIEEGRRSSDLLTARQRSFAPKAVHFDAGQ